MAQPSLDITQFTIEDIKRTNKLFFNYSSADITELTANAEFWHFWNFKRFQMDAIPDKSNSYAQLAYGFFSYFSDEMKLLIIHHAQKKYPTI